MTVVDGEGVAATGVCTVSIPETRANGLTFLREAMDGYYVKGPGGRRKLRELRVGTWRRDGGWLHMDATIVLANKTERETTLSMQAKGVKTAAEEAAMRTRDRKAEAERAERAANKQREKAAKVAAKASKQAAGQAAKARRSQRPAPAAQAAQTWPRVVGEQPSDRSSVETLAYEQLRAGVERGKKWEFVVVEAAENPHLYVQASLDLHKTGLFRAEVADLDHWKTGQLSESQVAALTHLGFVREEPNWGQDLQATGVDQACELAARLLAAAFDVLAPGCTPQIPQDCEIPTPVG